MIFRKSLALKGVIKINNIYVIAGLGYGDEGKGTIVDYLTRKHQAKTIIRYNGGSQAAHHVVAPNGLTHCFSQFGSGMMIPNVATYLSEMMLIDPLALEKEALVLADKRIRDALKRTTINGNCLIVTPFHKIIGQILELSRMEAKYGSVGMGVGQAVADGNLFGPEALRVRDLISRETLFRKLDFLWRVKLDLAEQIAGECPNDSEITKRLNQIQQTDYVERLADAYIQFISNSGVRIIDGNIPAEIFRDGAVIFEGAQGVLLDVDYGFWPYVTKTKITFENADKLLNLVSVQPVKIGVMRAYGTRHGPGPFITESSSLTESIPDSNNGTNEWQGPFRIGWFDLLTARYAIDVADEIDEIALTNLDRLSGHKKIRVCISYEYLGPETDELSDYFEWELTSNNRIKITKLKPVLLRKEGHQEQLTKLLFKCIPLEFIDFPGWETRLDGIAEFKELPKQAREYVEFFQSKEGLGIPISIISIGPTWRDKIEP